MRVRDVLRIRELTPQETRARDLIGRVLKRRGYRILEGPRLDQVLEAGPEELDDTSRAVFRTAHFSFVIAKDRHPELAVDLAAPEDQNGSIAEQMEAAKYDLCRNAGLLVLRISSDQLERHEGVSLLEWMLHRWIAWQREGPTLRRDVQEERARVAARFTSPEELDESGQAPASPEFYFDLRHPYPASLTLCHRLHNLGILTLRATAQTVARLVAARGPQHLAQCITSPAGEEVAGRTSRYTDYYARVRRWHPKDDRTDSVRGALLYTTEQRVQWQWAVLTGWDAPDMLTSEPRGGPAEPSAEWIEWWLRTANHVWVRDLPGAPPHAITEGLAEYLVLRDVERWARQHWAAES